MSSPQEIAMRLLEGGSESGGILRAVIDDDISSLIIVAGNGAEDESHGVYNYAYETFEASEEIKIQTAFGGVTATRTKTFSARLISKLYNSSGKLVMRADLNAKGKPSGFYDSGGKEIYTEKFKLSIGENAGISGADAPAIAWCMAKNSERSSSLTEQKEAYKAGCRDVDESTKEVIELDEDITDGIVDYDVDLDSTLFDEGSDGVYLKYFNATTEETCYVHIYNDGKPVIDMDSGWLCGYGRLIVEAVGSGISVSRNTIFQNVNYRSGVFKPGRDGYNHEVINGLKIYKDYIDASLVKYGWNYEGNTVRTPYWYVKDGFYCVNISTSVPTDIQ